MVIEKARILDHVGEYYFSSKLRELSELEKRGIEVINLGVGSPDMAPPSDVVDNLAHTVRMPDVHTYQSYKGDEFFLKSIAEWYEYYFNVKISSTNNILPLSGSKEGISFILHAFINPGDEVLIPDPGYPTYRAAALLQYAKIKTYRLYEKFDYQPDFDELENIVSDKTKIMFLNYPNMPTGMPGTKKLFERIVDFARKHKILLVNDNPYAFLHDKQLSILSVDGAFDVALELNSLSKSHNLAGWRIGFAFGRKDYIDTLLKLRSNFNTGHFMPFQKAVIKALSMTPDWYEHVRNTYLQRRKIVEHTLIQLDFNIKTGQKGMFVWAKIPHNFRNGTELADFLLTQANVFVTPGELFGKSGKNYIRISLCNDKKTLSEAMSRLQHAFLQIKVS